MKEFNWSQKARSYDCIFCIWGLGYLKRADNMVMLAGIKRALKPNGFIIFFESILRYDETKSRLHDTIEQQNVVRSRDYYFELFQQAGLRVSK